MENNEAPKATITDTDTISSEAVLKVSLMQLNGETQALNNFLKANKLNNRAMRRMVFAAVSVNTIENAKFDFQSRNEAIAAGKLANILDLRTTIQILRITTQDEKEKEDGQEEKN